MAKNMKVKYETLDLLQFFYQCRNCKLLFSVTRFILFCSKKLLRKIYHTLFIYFLFYFAVAEKNNTFSGTES